jgi:hypothetical protein
MMNLSANITKAAIQDPQYHRHICGLPLLFPIQKQVLEAVEKTIYTRDIPVWCIRSMRQTMKNEVDAFLCIRSMKGFESKGGNYIRTGLTNTQVVISKRRVAKFAAADPLTFAGKRIQWNEGGYLTYKKASIQVVSAYGNSTMTQGQTRAVGSTASISLSVDESHLIDEKIFNSTFAPMVAMTGAPKLLWGIAGEKTDILYKEICRILGRAPQGTIIEKGVINLPGEFWVEHLGTEHPLCKNYIREKNRLGSDNPIILINYDLVDIDAISGFLTNHQINNILDSDFERKYKPDSSKDYMILIDVAGGDELDIDAVSESKRDFSAVWIVEIDFQNMTYDFPVCRFVNLELLRNVDLTVQQKYFDGIMNIWKPTFGIVDGRGIGEQIASYLENRWQIECYKATAESVTFDCSEFLGMVNNNCIKVFRNDGSPEYNEITKQLHHTRKNIKVDEKLQKITVSISKPQGDGKIDAVKAMTYIKRAIDGVLG